MANVLVVDDEPNVRRSFTMFLRHGGHDVDAVGDAKHAMARLEARSFDVVLTDIVLENDDGMSLLERIADRWPDTQVILVTGQPSIDTAASAVRAGAFAYLRKPVSGPALLEVVNGAAQVKMLRDENRRLVDETRRTQEQFERLQARHQATTGGHAEQFLVDETRLLRIADNVPGVMYQLRREPNGRVSFPFLGRGCKELLHLDPEEVAFDPHVFFDCIHTDDRAAFESSLDTSAYEMSTWRWEGRMCPPVGDELWVQVHSTPVAEPDGAVVWDGVMIDVSDRKRLQAELMLADRLASVGSLVAGLVHEVNNPLTVVLANLELLASRVSALGGASGSVGSTGEATSDELLELTHDTLAQTERIRGVLSSLATFSPEDVEMTLVDVQRVLDDVLRLAENELRHRATVVRDYIDKPRVLANPALLSQLFLNLVLNAAQAIPEGDASSNEVRIGVARHAEGGIIVTIQDTGPGMPPDLQRRAFDPFVSTQSSPPAEAGPRGLGLYICHGIVRSLGGTLQVRSRAGRGSTFEVRLPRAAKVQESSAEDSGNFPRPSVVPRAKVLVIDDEPGIRRALVRALAEHEVDVADDGRSGLALALAGTYDIVFCDLMMPEVTGMEVFERVRVQAPALADRFVFITGGAFTKRARTFLEAVGNPRIKKPFDLVEIRAVLLDLLDA